MRPQPRSPTLRRQSPLHLPATPYPSHPLSLIMGRQRPSLLPVAPNLRNRHAIRSEAMRHNMHKQLYTRRVQTLHTKSPNSTHEETKLYTRRAQTLHTKNPNSTHEETVRTLQNQPFSQTNICSKIRTQEPRTEAKRSNAKGPRSLIIKQPGPFL